MSAYREMEAGNRRLLQEVDKDSTVVRHIKWSEEASLPNSISAMTQAYGGSCLTCHVNGPCAQP